MLLDIIRMIEYEPDADVMKLGRGIIMIIM